MRAYMFLTGFCRVLWKAPKLHSCFRKVKAKYVSFGLVFKIGILTHYRPAMPFGNRKKMFWGIYLVQYYHNLKILPVWKPEI